MDNITKILAEKNGVYDEIKEKEKEEKINSLIRKRYSISNEFAILRQRDIKIEEFLEYNAYVEECKAKVKIEENN